MHINKKYPVVIFLCIIIFLAIIYCLWNSITKKNDALYKQSGLFSECLDIIQSKYVDKPDAKKLTYGALKGLSGSLDPYSQFMDPQAFNELKADTLGKYGGLGMEISIKDGFPTVITPIEDTPAWRAGIKSGDRIIKINNEVTKDMSLTDTVSRLRGETGEKVDLTILREPEKKLLEFSLIRATIEIKGVKETKLLPGGIGYIRLAEFRDNSPEEIDVAIKKLTKAQGLIIDLRNNPGGSLEAAIKIAERFIDKGKLIVYIRGRSVDQNENFYPNPKLPVLHMPLAILINEGSASGSEIIAGSFQYYKIAKVIGKKSFGKGCVQTIIPLKDGSALRLTTSRYFLPGGKAINGIGIEPDIAIEPDSNPLNDAQLEKTIDFLKGKK